MEWGTTSTEELEAGSDRVLQSAKELVQESAQESVLELAILLSERRQHIQLKCHS